MSNERRFNDEETAFILERAAAAEPGEVDTDVNQTAAGATLSRGMTLQQLQEVAVEAGLNPTAVVAAARSIERGDLVPTRRANFVGLPVLVGRSINLDRPVTDTEWERMVVALREIFQARGRVQQEGNLRTWSNGNLQVLLEPTATGRRVRMQTRKSDAQASIGMGVGAVLLSGVFMVPLAMASATRPGSWLGPILLAAAGVALVVRTALTLPTWARTRAAQMERFSDIATAILDESPTARLPQATTPDLRK